MCLIALAWRHHTDYALVLAANRDEFFARPTSAADWWPGHTLLAGRDEKAGGTWLGVTAGGRFAALTNYRQGMRGEAADEDGEHRSRGALVTDYLHASDPDAFQRHIAADGDAYAGFSILYGDVSDGDGQMHYFCNRGVAHNALAPGVYGLSNALLDEPWPKVDTITAALARSLDQPLVETAALITMLDDRRRAADEALPETGVGIEVERLLSPPFIVSPHYGTRSSTVLLVRTDGLARFHERTFNAEGERIADRVFTWQLGESCAHGTAGERGPS